MGGDGDTSTNAKSMGCGSTTRNRSAGLNERHTGLADTDAGVRAWDGAAWNGDNFALPGRHAVEVWALELLSE